MFWKLLTRRPCEDGNYDWGIAIHPYPEPLTRVNYWSQEYDKSRDASHLSIMNLNVLTDMLSEETYLDRSGDIRSVTITELGFSSGSGERRRRRPLPTVTILWRTIPM